MISLLITLLIYLLVLGALWYIVSLLPLPHPFAKIAQIIIAVIGFILILYLLLGVVDGGPALTLRR
jgi:hypothetical protein